MDTEKVKDKIRKLFAVHPANGATEDEAANALRLAQILMTKHGLEHDDIGPGYQEPTPKVRRMAEKEVKLYEEMIARAAAKLCLCKSIRHIIENPRSKFPKIVGYTFVGLEEYIDAAEETMLYLLSQVDYLYKITVPNHIKDPKQKAHYRFSFKEGCAVRILQRVSEMMATPSKELVAATGSTALVVQHYWDKLQKLNDEAASAAIPDLRPVKANLHMGTGTRDGYRLGDQVQLRHTVGDNAEKPLAIEGGK